MKRAEAEEIIQVIDLIVRNIQVNEPEPSHRPVETIAMLTYLLDTTRRSLEKLQEQIARDTHEDDDRDRSDASVDASVSGVSPQPEQA